MNKTTNFQLPKWEKTDRILMSDFNDMTEAIDAAMLGKKLLLDYTVETAAATVEVPLTGVDWGSCALAVVRIVPSAAQAAKDTVWINFDGYDGSCRSLSSNTTYSNHFASGNLGHELLVCLFVGRSSAGDIAGLAFNGYQPYACWHSRAYADKQKLTLTDRDGGTIAAGTKVLIYGVG